MNIKVNLTLRGKFGFAEEERDIDITYLTYADLLRQLQMVYPNGRECHILANDGKLFINNGSIHELNNEQIVHAVFHSRVIKTAVTVIISEIFGWQQEVTTISVQHSNYYELVTGTERVCPNGRHLHMVIETVDAPLLNNNSYQSLKWDNGIVAIFPSREIVSTVKFVNVFAGDVTVGEGTHLISHFDFSSLQRGIRKVHDNHIFNIMIGETGQGGYVDAESYRGIASDAALRVELDNSGRFFDAINTHKGSFYDTTKAFQKLVLDFTAIPATEKTARRK
jgi:hypothetical protein